MFMLRWIRFDTCYKILVPKLDLTWLLPISTPLSNIRIAIDGTHSIVLLPPILSLTHPPNLWMVPI